MKTSSYWFRAIFVFRVFVLLAMVFAAVASPQSARATAPPLCYVKADAVGLNDGTSWTNAWTDLQKPLTGTPCDEVWVAAGTYTPGALRTDTFSLQNGVALYGGFAGTESFRYERDVASNVTTLSGNIGTLGSAADNSYHVVTADGTDATAVLDGFTITAGNADGVSPDDSGAGLYIHKASPTLGHLTVEGNHATDGAGMYSISGNPSLTSVTFGGNTSDGSGGGIFDSGGSPQLTDVLFNVNFAGDGGGMYNFASSPTLSSVTFHLNQALGAGGGLYNMFGSDPTLTNVTFNDNYAAAGGGLNNENSSPALTNVTFSHDHAINLGGGMFNSASSPTLTVVTFDTNDAGTSGGGMYNSASSPTLTDVTFDTNEAGAGGGGMYNSASSPTLTNGSFSYNQADTGGGMYNASGSDPSITHVTFISNSAPAQGGAIYNSSSSLTLTDVSFESNSSTYGIGGGLSNDSGSNATLTNVTFESNIANFGGGMSNRLASATLTNATFSGNGAMAGGGMIADASVSLELTNITFSGNYVTTNGGAMYFRHSGATIVDGIFWGNSSEMYNFGSYPLPVLKDSIVYGGCPDAIACTHVLGSDPLLMALADNGGFTKTMAISAGSAAIDAGGQNSTCAPQDQRGIWRPQGAACDIGAYERQAPITSWVGGVSVTSDRNVVAVGRPEIGSQVTAYDGFTAGSTTVYVPMLFRKAFGGAYNAALYIQDTDPSNTANITIQYYDVSGSPTCSHLDSITALSSKGYWMPAECMSDGWVGAAVITSNHNIVAVARPQIGAEITTYDGFASGSTSMYVPMLFRNAFGGTYNAALYVQNTDPGNSANITISYYDSGGTLTCSHADTIAALSSKGYWMPAECVSDGWVGGAVITANHNIVAVGRPHIGTQITAYDGFSGGTSTAYVPMMYKKADGGTDNAALYVQDLDVSNSATVSLDFYDRTGTLTCSVPDTIPPLSSHGYWLPSVSCLPDGWTGGVVIAANHDVVALGRPHFGAEVFAYDGFVDGNLGDFIPMLFANAFGGSYNAGFYLQNLDGANTAHVTLRYYDVAGSLTCTKTDTLEPLAASDTWVPDVMAVCP